VGGYHFYLSRDALYKRMGGDRARRRTFVYFVLLACLSIYIALSSLIMLFVPSPRFVSSLLSRVFSSAMVGLVLFPLALHLTKLVYYQYKSFEGIQDLWVNDRGIHLPMPIHHRGEERFISFNDIDRIVVVRHPTNVYRSVITIFVKFKLKTVSVFQPNDRLALSHINADEFVDAVRRASGDKVKIEHTDYWVW